MADVDIVVEDLADEESLRHLLDKSEDLDFRRRIRARLRQLKKESPPAIIDNKLRTEDAKSVAFQKSTPPSERTWKSPRSETSTSTTNGKQEFLQKSSNLRSVKTDSVRNSLPASSSVQLEPVALRNVTRPSDSANRSSVTQLEPVMLRNVSNKSSGVRKSEVPSNSGGHLETVVLRKVIHEKTDSSSSSPIRSKASTTVSTKTAFDRFKEMDLKFLEATGDDGYSGRRISPNPNSIKDRMLDWTRARVSCYENVCVDDFSTSWNDGMAFCALIHSFFPEAFDYDELDPANKQKNFQLAFDTAETCANIFPLLDVEDMIRTENPDWKCVFTYVNSIANRMSEIRREKMQELERLEKESV